MSPSHITGWCALFVVLSACGEQSDLDENGFLEPFPDGMITNGVCVPHGERFEDTYDCALVEGPKRLRDEPASSKVASPAPSRLEDEDTTWVVEELQACSCNCCHTTTGKGNYRWAMDFSPHWADSADEGVLRRLVGEYTSHDSAEFIDPARNNGFSREFSGHPTTDHGRLRRYVDRELARRAE